MCCQLLLLHIFKVPPYSCPSHPRVQCPKSWTAPAICLLQEMLWGLTSRAAAGMQESGSDDFAPSHAADPPSYGEPGLYPFPGQGMYDMPHADAWPEPRLPRGVRPHLLSLPAITQPACHERAHGLGSRARGCLPAGMTCCRLHADCSGRLLGISLHWIPVCLQSWQKWDMA